MGTQRNYTKPGAMHTEGNQAALWAQTGTQNRSPAFAKSKKNKSKGKPYKSATSMIEEFKISMDDLKTVIKAEEDAKTQHLLQAPRHLKEQLL